MKEALVNMLNNSIFFYFIFKALEIFLAFSWNLIDKAINE